MSDPRSRYRGYSFVPTGKPYRLDGWTLERRALRRKMVVGISVTAIMVIAIFALLLLEALGS